MNTLTSARRLVQAAEQYNDSPSASYTRSLDERFPYMRSSITPIYEMDEPAKRIEPSQRALYATFAFASFFIACLIFLERNT